MTEISPNESVRWFDYGECKGQDQSKFFPGRGESARPAKKICRTCPVAERCLEYALDNGEKFGIWGGKSERQRRVLRRERGLPDEDTMLD